MTYLARGARVLSILFITGCTAATTDEDVGALQQANEEDLPENSVLLDMSSLPSQLSCGESRPVWLIYIITVVSTWKLPTHFLGAVGDSDPMGGPGRVDLPADEIEPVDEAYFYFTLHAPEEPGIYTTRWQMLRENVRWFGQMAAREVEVTCEAPPNQYSELSTDDLPEEVFCGQAFTPHVTAKNVGDADWYGPGNGRRGVELRITPDSADFGPRVYPLPANERIEPQEQHTFTLPLHAPTTPDVYPLSFKMFDSDRQAWFGPTMRREVQVTCFEDASLPIRFSMPERVACGAPYPIEITYKNTGTADWTVAGGYRLGNPDPVHLFYPPNLRRVPLPGGATVRRNDEVTFSFSLTAPWFAAPAYVQAWQMVHDGEQGFFGPVVSQVVSVECQQYDAELVGITVGDTLACGASTVATLRLKNKGSQPWTASDQLVTLAGGLGPAAVRFPAGTNVRPGETAEIRLPITVPYATGLRYGRWQLAHDGVGPFGPVFAKDISLDCMPRDARLAALTSLDTDKCTLAPTFLVTVRNTGYLTWSRSNANNGVTRLVAVPSAGWEAAPLSVPVAPDDYVRPGDTYSFQAGFRRVAPDPSNTEASPGWRMSYEPPGGSGGPSGGGVTPFGPVLQSSLSACDPGETSAK